MTIRHPPRRPLALAACLAAGLLESTLGPRPSRAAAAPASPSPGERRFQASCASCHGPGGEGGRGPTLRVPRLTRVRDRAGLAKLIEKGVEGTEMPGHRMPARELQQLAAFVEALGRLPAERVPGDAQRGAGVYRGKGGCALCHSIAGMGGATGSDLTDVGLRRGARYLMTALTAPEADIPRATSPYRQDAPITQNFLQLRAVTRDGREINGVRVNEDTFSIQIRDATDQVHSLWKDDLAELDKAWGRSPMPSYAEALGKGELEDLVAFLLSLRTVPDAPDKPAPEGH